MHRKRPCQAGRAFSEKVISSGTSNQAQSSIALAGEEPGLNGREASKRQRGRDAGETAAFKTHSSRVRGSPHTLLCLSLSRRGQPSCGRGCGGGAGTKELYYGRIPCHQLEVSK